MGRKLQVGATVVTILILTVPLINVKPVWALSISPSSPVAGQPFTISGTSLGTAVLSVYMGSSCGGSPIAEDNVVGPYSFTLTIASPGPYSANDGTGCVPFTVTPASGPTSFVCVPCREAHGKSFYHDGKLNTDDA